MGASKPYDFAELALRHREALIALSSDQSGVAIAFEETQGAALAAAFDDMLAEQKPSGLMVQLGDYPDVFQTAYADRMVRRGESASAQLHIFGQLEARLTESDRRHSWRTGRGHMAAGAAGRSLAEPADAP